MVEKEISYKISKFDELLSFMKEVSKNNYKTNDITYQYFESDSAPHFYARIEKIVDMDSKIEKKFLTFKYGFKTVKGVNIRKEKTTEIKDPEFYVVLFKILGLSRKGTKHKIQFRFDIDGVDITINQWRELSSRIEVESNSIQKIKSFVGRIKDFIVFKNK